MHIVILGCGRVGSRLARELDAEGHSVALIDQNPAAFSKLPATFEGLTVTGVGFDRDTLHQAGIERASAFAAVSNGDNSNIIAARVARETYNVEHVVARIYDPRRAEIYQRLGIPTVATVAWSTAEIKYRLMPGQIRVEWRDPSGHVALGEFDLDPGWVGKRYSEVETAVGVSVAAVSRYGQGLLPQRDLLVQEDDRMHATFLVSREDEVVTLLGSPPGSPA